MPVRKTPSAPSPSSSPSSSPPPSSSSSSTVLSCHASIVPSTRSNAPSTASASVPATSVSVAACRTTSCGFGSFDTRQLCARSADVTVGFAGSSGSVA
eukprot:361754-Chlamydomonas_euryale.AAC.3